MKMGRVRGGVAVSLLLAACTAVHAEEEAPRDVAPKTLAIGRMAAPPQLDGRLDDWPADAAAFMLGQAGDTLRRASGWNGTRDLSGVIRLAWDEQYLYLAADVVDDQLHQAETTGASPWQGDGLELFFNTHPGQQRGDGFCQIALLPPLKPGASLAAVSPQGEFPGVTGTAAVHPGGYTLECRIPWKNLPGFAPAKNHALGFQLMLDDRDGPRLKSQLYWYPSAITFAHPTHMNTLLLRDRGENASPLIAAGPATACVTSPKGMPVSILTESPHAASAMVRRTTGSLTISNETPTVTVPLEMMGDRLAVGAGVFPLDGNDGPASFEVEIRDAAGRTLTRSTFQTELAAQRYAPLQEQVKAAQARITAGAATTDPAVTAGMGFWQGRIASLLANEARREAVTPSLLNQIVTEQGVIAAALDRIDARQDPYAGLTGSFVRAYRSPLTGEYRPYALFVPADYTPAQPRPLIVLLHGIFADERQLFLMSDTFRNQGAIVYQAAAYRQLDWSGVSAAETWAGLDDVLRHYNVERDRVYLIGHHIGGRGALQLAMDRPELFAAIAPLFPGIDTRPPYPALRLYRQHWQESANSQIPPPHFKPPAEPEPLNDDIEKKMYLQQSLATRAENIAALPLRLAYGEDQPDAAAERLALTERLAALGAAVPTHYVPGAMHGNTPPELNDPAFYRWLLAQRRSPVPPKLTCVATNLRHNQAWGLTMEALLSPLEPGRIAVEREGSRLSLQTQGVRAFSPGPVLVNAATGPVSLTVDGQAIATLPAAEIAALKLMRDPQGNWKPGTLPENEKRHGLSGPIQDFQFEKFLFVYGTAGTSEQTAALEKVTRKLANWGLGATFAVKADKDLSADDMAAAHVLLVGTPATNAVLGKMAAKLPLQWRDNELQLGEAKASGPGAGACLIYPNPLAPGRYAVIITALDPAGYQAWDAHAGVDYLLGHTEGNMFVHICHGHFDSRWNVDPALCTQARP